MVSVEVVFLCTALLGVLIPCHLEQKFNSALGFKHIQQMQTKCTQSGLVPGELVR